MRLGPKINAFVVVFLGTLALVTAGLLAFGFHRSQDSARDRSREGLIEEAGSEILYQAATNAFIGNTFVDEATDSAAEAAALLVDLPETGARVPFDAGALATSADGRRYDADPDRASDVFVPAGVTIDAPVERDLRDSAALDALFPALLAGMPDAIAIFYTSVEGVTRYYPPSGFGERAPATRPPDDVEALRRMSPQLNPAKAPYWTPPYQDASGQGLLLTSYTPVYDGDEFRGMIGVDLSLERLIGRVDAIHVEAAPSSFAFVVSSDGTVIPGQGAERVRRMLEQADADEGFLAAIESMRARETGAEIVRFEGRDVFIGYAPLGAVGGSLAIVAPVDEVTAGAEAVAAEIGDEGRLTIGITLAAMLVFFLVALGATAWLTRRALVRPIEALVEGTRAVAAGDLHTAIPVRSGDEIGVLATSFNEMTSELARTRERVDEQQALLRASETELRTLFSAMTDAVLVLDRDGRYLRAAPTRHRTPVPDASDYVGSRVHDRMPPDRAARLMNVLQTAIDTGEVQYVEHDSDVEGEQRWFASVVSPLGDGTAMVVGRDITERVQAGRLLEQRVEERTREIASLLEVSRNVASTLEMPRLLELILDEMGTVAPFHRAAFLLRQGDELVSVATRDVDEERARRELGLRFGVGRRAKIWDAVSRGEPVIIGDIRGDGEMARAYRGAVGASLDTAYADITSWMAVPLALKDRVIGMLALSAPEPEAYSERHAHLAGAIASQAAVALENARLFAEAEDRRRELASLLDVAASVASTLDLDRLVPLIADRLQEIIGFTGASILIAEGDEFVIRHSRPVDTGAVGLRFPLSRAPTPLNKLTRGEPVIIDDVLSDDEAAQALRGLLGDRLNWPAFQNVRSWIGIPMMLQDRPVGVISMSHSRAGFLTPEHARVTMGFASHAAIAFENARLYGRAQQAASLEERARLARELHDSVSQALYGIALGARTARTQLDRDPSKAVEPVDYVLSLAEAGLAEMRALIFELRPESLELEGLVAGLQKQADALKARHGITVDVDLCGEPPVPLTVKEAVSRIAQEAMHNTVKHARATRVGLRLFCDGGTVTLDIEDNGQGFDPSQTFAGHLGLRSMRERAADFGGAIVIESTPGAGTRIRLSIPVTGLSG